MGCNNKDPGYIYYIDHEKRLRRSFSEYRPKKITHWSTKARESYLYYTPNDLPFPIPPDPKLAPKSHYSNLHWRITYYAPNQDVQVFTMPDHWVEYKSCKDGKYHAYHNLPLVVIKNSVVTIKTKVDGGRRINISGNYIVEPCCKQCVNFPHEKKDMESFTCKCGRKYHKP